MSNVIDFLEKWGQDSQLRHATSAELEQALLRAGIEPAERAAIFGADRCALESLLGARGRVVCAIFAPEEEENEEEDEDGEEKEKEKEDVEEEEGDGKKKAELKSRNSAGRRVA
jgi:Skp family chaperone for outer membrane proteins